MRAELPALHLHQEIAHQRLEQQGQVEVARIDQRRDAEISILDKLIEKARELAIEVKERKVAVAHNLADRVEHFRGQFERWREQRVESKPEQDLDTQQAIHPSGNQERAGPELDSRTAQQLEQGRQAFRDRYEAYRQSQGPQSLPNHRCRSRS